MAALADDQHRREASSTISSGVVKRVPRANARAWRHEEEDYLLQARKQSIPYKQIAARLRKTELACRLHYHQMTLGSNRGQTSLTVNDTHNERSRGSRSICEGNLPGTLPGHANPLTTVSYSPSPRIASSTSPASTSSKSYASPAASAGTEWCRPQTCQTCSSGANVHNHGIGMTWHHASSPMLAPPAVPQDAAGLGRLLYEYADSSRAFFSTLANQFSQSPAELEAAFRTALGQKSSSLSVQPDRRDVAPLQWPCGGTDNGQRRVLSESQENLNSDLHAPSPKRCTVSSLLNFEKDTGSHKWAISGA